MRRTTAILLAAAAAACLTAGVEADKCLMASSIVEVEAVEAAAAAKFWPSVRLVAADAPAVKGAAASEAGDVSFPTASAFGSGESKLPFDTDVASGYLATSVEKNNPYWTIKIQFKVATGMNDLVLASVFEKPLNVPGKGWLKSMMNTLTRRVTGPGSDIDLTAEQPYVFFPVMNIATAVAVDDAETPLIGSSVAHNLPGGRTFWSKLANRKDASFEVGKHYTIVILERCNFETYSPWWAKNLDAVKLLNGQPVQFMLADAATDTTFFQYDLWSQKIAKAYTSQHCSTK